MAAAWPGGYGPIRDSPLYDHLDVAAYPAGPACRVSYSGAHAWAVPTTCADVDAALDLLVRLCTEEAGALDGASGSVCAHSHAMESVKPHDDTDARRLAITRDTISQAMITYPPLVRFPEVEDAGWSAINAALRGQLRPEDAVIQIQRSAERTLA